MEQETQRASNGVVLFCRIVYDEKYFVGSQPCIRLTRVKGGVVRNGDTYWCEMLQLKYKVCGDAYDASGQRLGWRAKEIEYCDKIYNPTVGMAFTIGGAHDWYFDTRIVGTAIVGFVKGHITYRMTSNRYTVELTNSITGS